MLLCSDPVDNQTEARRGIAAAITSNSVALMPGQSSMSLGGAAYRDAGAVSVNFSHRFMTAIPLYISAGYANGGGSEHIGKAALTVVW